MHHRSLASGLFAITLVAGASPAHAGFPGGGTIGEIQRSLFRYVCSNNPQIVCQLDPNFGTFDPDADCGVAVPPRTCELDVVPNTDIRAALTIIADDKTPDPRPPGDGDVRTTVMLEFQIGEDRYALADFFPENTKIAEWFYVPEESDIFHFDFSGGSLLNGSLTPLRQKLEAIGKAKLGVPATGVSAVMFPGGPSVFGLPKPQELETDASAVPSAGSAGNPLASIARYRVTIRFAKLRP
jgi:hypothetical protein